MHSMYTLIRCIFIAVQKIIYICIRKVQFRSAPFSFCFYLIHLLSFGERIWRCMLIVAKCASVKTLLFRSLGQNGIELGSACTEGQRRSVHSHKVTAGEWREQENNTVCLLPLLFYNHSALLRLILPNTLVAIPNALLRKLINYFLFFTYQTPYIIFIHSCCINKKIL